MALVPAGRRLDRGAAPVQPRAGRVEARRARGNPILPMLATAAAAAPRSKGYGYEFKWDGYRALIHVEDGRVRIDSRNLRDVTDDFPTIANRAARIAEKHLILDGEILAFDDEHKPSFGLLQQHLQRAGTPRAVAVDYFPFDVLRQGSRSLLSTSYQERREVLVRLFRDDPDWNVPPHRVDAAPLMIEASRATHLEGIVAKRLESIYRPGERSRDWLKVKNRLRQEFVVGGWVPERGTRVDRVGSLLVGYYASQGESNEAPGLVYAGRVGTGFDDSTHRELVQRLRPIERADTPFHAAEPDPSARYVKPLVVVEVAFTEWTDAGVLRQPSFLGLRDDKDPAVVRRERPVQSTGGVR